MLSDPRYGRTVALAIVGAVLVWFAALWIASDDLFARLGMSMHAITFVAIVVGLVAAAAAMIFGRYGRVKADLLGGRDVIAAWSVDPATFAVAAPAALARDRREKRQVMAVIIAFIVLIFGAFALFDPEAAPAMLAIAAVVAAVIVVAYAFSQRIQRRHSEMRSGEVVVGRRGLQFNGVLHVWGLPLNWLSGVELSSRPPALTVTYDFLTRAGVQTVSVDLPVPAAAMSQARHAEKVLKAMISPRRRSR